LLREAPAFAVGRAVNALATERTTAAVHAFAARASRLGVTGIVDFEMAWNRDDWVERMADGWAGPRIEAAVYPQHLERAAALGMRTGGSIDPGLPLLRTGPLKTLIDGALNTRTAYCADAYPDGGHGVLTVPLPELRALLGRAKAIGFVPAVHAIGDAGISVALDAFEAEGMRGRIEHAQLVAHEDLARFAALGVTASVQPAHLLDDRRVAAEHWPGRTARAYPFRALLDAGATLAFGSDAPVARLDPWLAIRAAIDRSVAGEPPWHPEQRITLEEALAASTRGRSEPRVGDDADLAVLDEPLDRPRDGEVAATLVAGTFTHRTF
jgi:predicted amidohydrolase YtcJ